MVRKRLLTIGLLLSAAVLLLVVAGAARAEFFVFAAAGAVIGALREFALMLKDLWIATARAAFTRCELKVLQPEARLGETIEVEVALEPKRPLTVSSAKLTLNAHEYAHRPSRGPNDTSATYDDKKVKATAVLDVPRAFVAPFSRVVRMQVPMDQPPTFKGENDRLYTTVRLDLAIDGKLDVSLTADVLVLPEVAA